MLDEVCAMTPDLNFGMSASVFELPLLDDCLNHNSLSVRKRLLGMVTHTLSIRVVKFFIFFLGKNERSDGL